MNTQFQRLARLGLLMAILALSACASINTNPTSADLKNSAPPVSEALIPPPEAAQHQAQLEAIKDFKIEGRLGVQSQGQGVSGNIHWSHSQENDVIDLYSPFGNKIAAIVKTPDGVSLDAQDGKTVKAEDAETLTELTLGWRLPISKLSDWILGRPANGLATGLVWDEKGHLSKMTQDGWELSFLQYKSESHPFLPSKINMRNPKMNLRIVIESWDTSPQNKPINNANAAPAP
jgi:outer membrane lipoprotein LolB